MLQRSVTETRRLASGRPNVSRSTSDMGGSGRRTTGGIDPRSTAGRAQPFLPHGHAPLHLSDPVAARVEGLRPVRRRRDDRDARLARGDPPQPVPHGDPGSSPSRPDLRDDTAQLPLDHLVVGGVLDRGHAVLLRAVADRAEKPASAAALGSGDLGEQGGEGDGRAHQVHGRALVFHTLKRVLGTALSLRTVIRRAQALAWERDDRTSPLACLTHPPAIGGSSATSSPSRTLASSFTCCKFTAVRGRSGKPWPPGSSSRTRRTTSPTVAGSGTATAASARPTSSA